MAAAESALGESKAHNHCMNTGPGAHILSYPIAQHTLLNVVIFLSDSESDKRDDHHARIRSRDEILSPIKGSQIDPIVSGSLKESSSHYFSNGGEKQEGKGDYATLVTFVTRWRL